MDSDGRSVQVNREGSQEFYEADIVVIWAGAANSAKILPGGARVCASVPPPAPLPTIITS